jgi:hypothetical protein
MPLDLPQASVALRPFMEVVAVCNKLPRKLETCGPRLLGAGNGLGVLCNSNGDSFDTIPLCVTNRLPNQQTKPELN